jgi:hypothetical protein
LLGVLDDEVVEGELTGVVTDGEEDDEEEDESFSIEVLFSMHV